MWYTANKKEQKEETKDGVDSKIVRNLAENSIRRNLFLQGQYHPSQMQLRLLTNKVLKKIETKFKDSNLIRAKTTNEELAPIIESIVDDLI